MTEAGTSETLTLAQLQVGQRLRGLLVGQIVTLIAVDEIAADLLELSYRDDDGQIAARMVTAEEVGRFELAGAADSAPAYDADADEFRLAAEALRIKYAALYDPMVAVNSSNIDPLPHQIRAVYEELLPRIPLRFLLADDPGAGKTIMAGLYLKELILRSDCERVIIVPPGGLVEQWREELTQKFGLRFEIFSPQMVEDAQGQNVFAEHPLLIARMDQLARNEDLIEQLADVNWDLAIVDEAHRMSARYLSWVGEVDATKRFQLGRLLSETAHNFLLMTATPHAGKEEEFQLFMSLLDRDRFEGKYRSGEHRTDTTGLMRRMVKEEMLTFAGKPLFPERKAYTVEYELSVDERDLYEQVTEYVRTEMGRADQIAEGGDKKRGNNIGFALTVLQRRLASSPNAIRRSLERRNSRLSQHLLQARRVTATAGRVGGAMQLPSFDLAFAASFSIPSYEAIDEEVSYQERELLDRQAGEVVDRATAAQTIPELEAEIAVLERLIEVARVVCTQDEDTKWVQLRGILNEQILTHSGSGDARKIIIFTEHRDTLDYLQTKIIAQFGRSDAVITIHGGIDTEQRKLARERFTHNPETVVLLATDAAGEGFNLQRAHLMVNYDLPWNPNRIEQRFGRIHRIGQREVCHLWNLVAKDTREGDVFARLLAKIDRMREAYNGNLFNVLGDDDAFDQRSLRELLIEAIRYGDRPEVKAKLDSIIDAGVADGLDAIRSERALHPEMFSALDLDEVRARMEQARERRLQPGYIAAFFIPALRRLGGRIHRREPGRYEITRVPKRVVDVARSRNRWAPVAERYERISFEPESLHRDGSADAALIAPGHPLLTAIIEATIDDLGQTLKQGAVLVDRRSEQAAAPMLMFSVEQRIENVSGDTVSHHFDYPLLEQDGTVTVSAAPPYLDYDRPEGQEAEAIAALVGSGERWLHSRPEKLIRAWAYREGLKPRLEEVKTRFELEAARTAEQVKSRLLAEINYWDGRYSSLREREREGQVGPIRADSAYQHARQLERRLDSRLEQLAEVAELLAPPAIIRGAALIIPSRLLTAADAAEAQTFARRTEQTERRAVAAVLAAERALGRQPQEMARNNPGYDICSTDRDGRLYYIEVKGRIEGADTFTVTANEVAFAQTQAERHRLALVAVAADGPQHDDLRYLCAAFDHIEQADSTRSYNELWHQYWDRGGRPL